MGGWGPGHIGGQLLGGAAALGLHEEALVHTFPFPWGGNEPGLGFPLPSFPYWGCLFCDLCPLPF